MSRVVVRPVEGRRELRLFFELPARLHRDDPAFVPPLVPERLLHVDPRRNPFFRHIDITWYLAFRDGEPVGRVSAQVDRKHLARHADGAGFFGFLDAVDDPEVFAALMETVEEDLRRRGMARVRGPFDPSINDTCGLLVEGFEHPPAVMMGHARPWYRIRLEALGYRREKDLIAYQHSVQQDWPPAARRMLERIRRISGLSFRPLEMRRYREEIRLLVDIFNDAWAENWGFVPFDAEEAEHLATMIRPLVTARSFCIGEVDGEPAAMAVGLPDFNEMIRDLGGRLLPLGWAKLAGRLLFGRPRRGRMPLMGVRRRFHGTPKGAALALGVVERVWEYHRGRGMRWAELSWVLEDNRPIRQMIETLGGVPYKRYRIYGKELA